MNRVTDVTAYFDHPYFTDDASLGIEIMNVITTGRFDPILFEWTTFIGPEHPDYGKPELAEIKLAMRDFGGKPS